MIILEAKVNDEIFKLELIGDTHFIRSYDKKGNLTDTLAQNNHSSVWNGSIDLSNGFLNRNSIKTTQDYPSVKNKYSAKTMFDRYVKEYSK